MKLHKATDKPHALIESLARNPNQPPTYRMYRAGYEAFFDMLPKLEWGDPLLTLKINNSGNVMKSLGAFLKHGQESAWLDVPVEPQTFMRHILAVEEPKYSEIDWELSSVIPSTLDGVNSNSAEMADKLRKQQTILSEGAEIIVAHWGRGFVSPVHGHAEGLLYEEILSGRMLVNTYRFVNERQVRPVRVSIHGPGVLISDYAPPSPNGRRVGLIHNFRALEQSVSLHYVAEHTRDGRDNQFEVEWFEDVFPLTKRDVRQIDSEEGRRLQVGDVCLVRSSGVPEYGDHYIIITGGLVSKAHGLRPDDSAIPAPKTDCFLDGFGMTNSGLRLLKLDDSARAAFLDFHSIAVHDGEVHFPQV